MHRLDLQCFSPAFRFDLETMKQAAEVESSIVVIAERVIAERVIAERVIAERVIAERDCPREMIGFVILHLEDTGPAKYAYIVTLDVASEARRSGIATLMLDHAEEQARTAGAPRVVLHVAVDNLAAINFYERQGYVKAGLAKEFYREAGMDALVYAKQLKELRRR